MDEVTRTGGFNQLLVTEQIKHRQRYSFVFGESILPQCFEFCCLTGVWTRAVKRKEAETYEMLRSVAKMDPLSAKKLSRTSQAIEVKEENLLQTRVITALQTSKKCQDHSWLSCWWGQARLEKVDGLYRAFLEAVDEKLEQFGINRDNLEFARHTSLLDP